TGGEAGLYRIDGTRRRGPEIVTIMIIVTRTLRGAAGGGSPGKPGSAAAVPVAALAPLPRAAQSRSSRVQTAPSWTRTGNLTAGSYAGGHSARPSLMSNLAPCRTHSMVP